MKLVQCKITFIKNSIGAECLLGAVDQRLHSGEDGREDEINEALRFGNGRDQGCFANDAEGVPILA